MSKPVAVLISDIHFTPNTLELASKALRMAQDRAIELGVPLVLAGDTLDSKAVMRAECVNELILMLRDTKQLLSTYVLVGNHDLINEKGTQHSLEFLKPYVTVISDVAKFRDLYFMAYQTDSNKAKSFLEAIPKGSTVICHQGVQTAKMGHYVQDKTSLPPEVFKDHRVISGHYHARQDIKCGRPQKGAVGLFSYIGNPYTQNFGEACDPEKGFQVLYDNGLLKFVPSKCRKHIIIEHDLNTNIVKGIPVNPDDLIWLKVRGAKSQLDLFDKQQYGNLVFGHDNYKLDLIPIEIENIREKNVTNSSDSEIFDEIIDNINESNDFKSYMKILWREILENT